MKKCLITVTVLLMVALLSTAAMAANSTATTPVQITINPGELWIEMSSGSLTFDNISIPAILAASPGFARESATNPTYTVQDATGSGLGWHVNFNITKLNNTAFTPNKTLDVKFDQTAASLAVDPSYPDSQPVSATKGPLKVAVSKTNLNTDERVVTADTAYGMGTYTFATTDADFTIPIEAEQAFAGTYSGVFTATVLQGPGGTGSWTGHIE